MDWLSRYTREDSPRGSLGVCTSAEMSPELRRAVLAVPEHDWRPHRAPGSHVDARRDVAEVRLRLSRQRISPRANLLLVATAAPPKSMVRFDENPAAGLGGQNWDYPKTGREG